MLHLLYFQEVMPWSAVVCPSGYFVSKLKYHFSVPGSDSDERPPAFNANPFNENLPQPAGGAGPPPGGGGGGGGGGPQQGFPQGGNVPPRMPPNMQGMPPNMQGMPPNMNIKGALPNFPGRPPANMRPLPAYRPPMEQYGGPRNTDPDPRRREHRPTERTADRAAEADVFVRKDPGRIGRRLLQFNGGDDDLNVAKMDQGHDEGQYLNGGQGQGHPRPFVNRNGFHQNMGDGQRMLPPNQGYPPHMMGEGGFPPQPRTPPPIHGVPIETPIEGTNMLTLHDAFDLWVVTESAERWSQEMDEDEALKAQEEILRPKDHPEAHGYHQEQDPHLREALENSRYVRTGHNTTHYLRGRHGPCPALLHCVGYQACLFRFSNEFCLRDPYPGTSHSDGTCRELFLVPLPLFHPWISMVKTE